MKLHVDLSKDIKLPKEAGLPFFSVALKSVETVLFFIRPFYRFICTGRCFDHKTSHIQYI